MKIHTRKNKKKKLMLAVSWLLLAASLAGCASEPAIDESGIAESETVGIDVTETEPIETEAPVLSEHALVVNGEVKYRIVRPDAAGSDSAAVKAAVNLKKFLEMKYVTAGSVEITTDYEKSEDGYEILIGNVDRDERREVSGYITYGEYIIWTVKNSIVIYAGSDSDYEYAIDKLCITLDAFKKANDDKSVSVTVPVTELNRRVRISDALASVPVVDGAELQNTYSDIRKVGYAFIKSVSVQIFKDYLAKLEAKGFVCFSVETGVQNPTYEYYNDKYRVELTFYRSAKRITMLISPRGADETQIFYYGLCTADGIQVKVSEDAATAVSVKKANDVVHITKMGTNGYYSVCDEGEGKVIESKNVEVYMSLSLLKANAAVTWARMIANDNEFHYGHNDWAHHYGCYFCGTNSKTGTKCKNGANYEDQLKTYCCNPLVTAAYCHGAGAIKEGYDISVVVNCKSGNINLANDSNQAISNKKYWALVEKPESLYDLIPGDILLTPTHAMIYSGDGKLIEASGGDDNVKNSSKWDNSIREISISASKFDGFTKIYRYIGN